MQDADTSLYSWAYSERTLLFLKKFLRRFLSRFSGLNQDFWITLMNTCVLPGDARCDSPSASVHRFKINVSFPMNLWKFSANTQKDILAICFQTVIMTKFSKVFHLLHLRIIIFKEKSDRSTLPPKSCLLRKEAESYWRSLHHTNSQNIKLFTGR